MRVERLDRGDDGGLTPGKRVAVHEKQDDHQHARECGQRRFSPAIQVGRSEGRQHVKAEHHPLRGDDIVEHERNDEQREQNPQLFVHLLEAADGRMLHDRNYQRFTRTGATDGGGIAASGLMILDWLLFVFVELNGLTLKAIPM